MSYASYNANPIHKRVGDCTVRAISKALNQDWQRTYVELAFEGFIMCDMPSSNAVWGAYLRGKGFTRRIIPENCEECYTVADFAADHPEGTYILAISGHVVCVEDGNYFDSWDSGDEIPLFYWERKKE